MKLSVVIATHNRAVSLARVMRSLVEARKPADWELIVVDNGCTDDTTVACARFAGQLPMHRISEPTIGLSHARNAGVRAAQGDCILWTDDDVTVGREWLVAYEAAIAADPAASFFGGPVSPRLEGLPPPWLVEALPVFASSYGARAPVEGMIDADTVELPAGANFAVRTEVQRRHAFDPALGRQPGSVLIGGEEIALMRRLIAEGAHGRWVSGAGVEHRIGPDRQTIAWLRSYWSGQGWAESLQRAARGERSPGLVALARTALRRELDYRAARRRSDRLAEARALLAAATARGALAYRYSGR